MAQKFKEAIERLFINKFVCKKCKIKKRVNIQSILKGKVTCKCGSKSFRALKRK